MKQTDQFTSSAFVVKFPLRPQAKDKIRVVVSTKIAKKAVARNRVRRLIKEAWRLSETSNLPQPHIYTKKTVVNLSFEEIKNEISKILKKINKTQ